MVEEVKDKQALAVRSKGETRVSKVNELLDSICVGLMSKHGKESVFPLKGYRSDKVPVVRTDLANLDYILGCGGIPFGRIIEIYGPDGVGKTSLVLEIIKRYQEQYENAVSFFIDAEHALDLNYASSIGVDLNSVLISQPDNGEEGFQLAMDFVNLLPAGGNAIVVIDSVTGLMPKSIVDGEVDEANIGAHARLMSNGLKHLSPLLSSKSVSVIFTNQLRLALNLSGYGVSKMVPTGGNALKFYASMRLELSEAGLEIVDGVVKGKKVKVKVVKNKLAPPFREAVIYLEFGKGYDKIYSLVDFAIAKNVIIQSGSWFNYQDKIHVQGRGSVIQMIEQDNNLFKSIYNSCMEVR